MAELLSGNDPFGVPTDHRENLERLLEILNHLEIATGFQLHCTSGYRSWPQHKEIYRQINDTRLIQGKPELPIPLHSQHLVGRAADLLDPRGDLQSWMKRNVWFLEHNGCACEAFEFSPSWVHLQSVTPKSGKRFFRPY